MSAPSTPTRRSVRGPAPSSPANRTPVRSSSTAIRPTPHTTPRSAAASPRASPSLRSRSTPVNSPNSRRSSPQHSPAPKKKKKLPPLFIPFPSLEETYPVEHEWSIQEIAGWRNSYRTTTTSKSYRFNCMYQGDPGPAEELGKNLVWMWFDQLLLAEETETKRETWFIPETPAGTASIASTSQHGSSAPIVPAGASSSVTPALPTTLIVAPNDLGSQTPATQTTQRSVATTTMTPRAPGFSKPVTPASTRAAAPTPKRSAPITTTTTRAPGSSKTAVPTPRGTLTNTITTPKTSSISKVPCGSTPKATPKATTRVLAAGQGAPSTAKVTAGSSTGVVKKAVTPASTRAAASTPKRSATVTTTATRAASSTGVVKSVATQATNSAPKTITTAQPSTVTRRVTTATAGGSSAGAVKRTAAAGSAPTISKTGDTTTDIATRSSRLPKAVPSPSKASTRVLITGQGAMNTPKVGSTPGKAATQRAPVRTPLVGRSTPSVKATTSIAGDPSTGVARKAASVSVQGSSSTNRRTGIPTREP